MNTKECELSPSPVKLLNQLVSNRRVTGGAGVSPFLLVFFWVENHGPMLKTRSRIGKDGKRFVLGSRYNRKRVIMSVLRLCFKTVSSVRILMMDCSV